MVSTSLARSIVSHKTHRRVRSGTCRADASANGLFCGSARTHRAEERGHSGRAAGTGCFGSTTSAGVARVASDTELTASTADGLYRASSAALTDFTGRAAAAGLASTAAASLASTAAAASLASCAARGAARVVIAAASHQRDARAERDHCEQAS